MGRRWGSGGDPSHGESRATGATYTPSYTGGRSSSGTASTRYVPPTYSSASGRRSRSLGGGRLLAMVGTGVLVVVVVGAAALGFALVGARRSLHSTRASLKTTKAQLASVQNALSRDSAALQTERQVGIYMRGVRDALAPAHSSLGDSSSAASAASAKAADQQILVALAGAKAKIGTLAVPASLKTADDDIRSAIDLLASGLQAEIQAIDRQSLAGLDSALTLENQALEHLRAAEAGMYTSVGTAGPASGTS